MADVGTASVLIDMGGDRLSAVGTNGLGQRMDICVFFLAVAGRVALLQPFTRGTNGEPPHHLRPFED